MASFKEYYYSESILSHKSDYNIVNKDIIDVLSGCIASFKERAILRMATFRHNNLLYYVIIERRRGVKGGHTCVEPHFGAFVTDIENILKISDTKQLLLQLKHKKDILKILNPDKIEINSQLVLSYVLSVLRDYIKEHYTLFIKLVTNEELMKKYIKLLPYVCTDLKYTPIDISNEIRTDFDGTRKLFLTLILRKSKDLDKQDVLKSLSNINLSNYIL
ncbi:hypothetical protein vBCjeMWX1_0180 [Campylobacter phage vB_CjeM_WX1]|nr:hypothetical protein vBCjeMWX1_0180 [Campylobacter phage vB_CjeM_WX1]